MMKLKVSNEESNYLVQVKNRVAKREPRVVKHYSDSTPVQLTEEEDLLVEAVESEPAHQPALVGDYPPGDSFPY